MAFSVSVRKTAGWEIMLDVQGLPREDSTPVDLIEQVKVSYPPSKIKLYEVLTLQNDYSYDGGSLSGLAVSRQKMMTKLLPMS